MQQATHGILQTALTNLDHAVRRLGLADSLLTILSQPKEKIELAAYPELGDGQLGHVRFFVVRHNDSLGPSKGGIRMAPSVVLDDIVGLAMEMTWKTALIGVPFGGGKSGICCDPARLTPHAKETIIRAYCRAASRHIGPEIYVPAPDMGTNERDMGHIRDCISYSLGISITRGCYVTGKPVILGGIVGRREATGNGVVCTILEACNHLAVPIRDARVAVQGFGNVGSIAAASIARTGARVVAVSDVGGGVENPNGLDIDALIRHANEAGTIHGFPGGAEIAREAVLEAPCDILIPAASQSQITAENAPRVRARIIAEGANSPTTPDADEILHQRGVFIIPDILCNAGGVFVSYLEYAQETQREQMSLEQVNQRLAFRMREKFARVLERAESNRQPMRAAAMDLAVQAVVDSVIARGFLP